MITIMVYFKEIVWGDGNVEENLYKENLFKVQIEKFY